MSYLIKLEEELARSKVENTEKWDEIIPEIPAINFKKEWSVKIVPPFRGAVARFYIDYNNRHVSVYLDWYDQLGFVGQPYYEVYDGTDTSRYLLNETDEMMFDIDRVLNGEPLYVE